MEIKHLEQFLVTANLENMTQAAIELHIAQSALSRTISQLESELELKLFSRTGKFISLNENGHILKRYTEQIFKNIDALHAHSKTVSSEIDNNNISIMFKSFPFGFPELLNQFSQVYKDTSFKLLDWHQVEEDVAQPYDFLVDCSAALPSTNSSTVSIFSENMMLAIPTDNPILKRNKLSLLDFASEPFISFPRTTNYGNNLIHYCENAGFSPNVTIETSNINVLMLCVELGNGIALVPEYTWNLKHYNNVALIQPASPLLNYTLLQPITTPLSKRCRRFLDFAVKNYPSIVSNVIR